MQTKTGTAEFAVGLAALGILDLAFVSGGLAGLVLTGQYLGLGIGVVLGTAPAAVWASASFSTWLTDPIRWMLADDTDEQLSAAGQEASATGRPSLSVELSS